MKNLVDKPVSINISFSVNQKSVIKQSLQTARAPARFRDCKSKKSVTDQIPLLNFQRGDEMNVQGEKSRQKKSSHKKAYSNNNDRSQSFKNAAQKDSNAGLSDRYSSKDVMREDERKEKNINHTTRGLHKGKRKQQSMDICKQQLCKLSVNNQVQKPSPYHHHKSSFSQNLRRKLKPSTHSFCSNNESSRPRCIYSNNLIRSMLENPTERKKNNSLKMFINELVRKELSKRTLYDEYGKQRTKRKVGKGKTREKYIEREQIQIKQTQKESTGYREALLQFVDRLSSLKSMDSSVLRSQMPQEFQSAVIQSGRHISNVPNLRSKEDAYSSKYCQTEQSALLIKQIKQFQKLGLTSKSRKYQQNQIPLLEQPSLNQKETHQIINTYIALLNEEQNQHFDLMLHDPKERTQVVHSEFGNNDEMQGSRIDDIESPIATNADDIYHREDQSSDHYLQFPENYTHSQEKSRIFPQQNRQNNIMPKIILLPKQQFNEANPTHSQIQSSQGDLSSLPLQQVEKWRKMISFMMVNINSESSRKEVIDALYRFLGSSEGHLAQVLMDKEAILEGSHNRQDQMGKQKELEFALGQSEQQRNKECKNEFGRNMLEVPPQLDEKYLPGVHSRDEQFQKSVSQGSSSSFDSINSSTSLINLTTIDKILKNRHNQLMERKIRDINHLQQRFQAGKLTQQEISNQRRRIDKWIQTETQHILKAKKSIWKGYNQVKGIIGKIQKTEQFQEGLEGRKKKKMMRCLSDKYIRKNKRLQNKPDPHEKQESSSGDEVSEAILVEQAKAKFGDKAQKLKVKKEQIQEDDKNYDQEMNKIKERLMRMKQHHLQKECLNSQEQERSVSDSEIVQLPELSPAISYQQVDKDFPGQSFSNENPNIIEPSDPQQVDNMPLSSGQLSNGQLSKEQFVTLANQRKLKYLCQEDKEDIFQFIFLDLCIELYQQPCLDNKIMKNINNHIQKTKRNAKKNKGVRTNLNIVKQYLKRFQAFIYRAHKQTLSNLNAPMGPTAYQMLRYMRDTQEIADACEDEVSVAVVVSVEVFDKFEKSLLSAIEFQPYFEDEQREQQRVQFLKNVLHIHNKAIFDALNQSLDHERPFGLWGVPFPWKKCPAPIRIFTNTQLEDKFKRCCDNVAEYCAYVCGLLTDKQESLVGSAHLSEEYLMSIRQDRLSRMLANDVLFRFIIS